MVGPIDTSAFNRLGQFASSPGNGAYCYAELAVSSIAVAETIALPQAKLIRQYTVL